LAGKIPTAASLVFKPAWRGTCTPHAAGNPSGLAPAYCGAADDFVAGFPPPASAGFSAGFFFTTPVSTNRPA